jgi:hypothetical protein
MSDVNTIFFDFGGVLLVHMDGIDHQTVEAQFGLPERTLLRCLYGKESRYFDLQIGACTHDEWIESIRLAAVNHMDTEIVDAFMDAWQNAERLLNEDMIALVGRLRANGYTTGIISNTIPGMEERLQTEMPHLVPLFDIRVGSATSSSPSRILPSSTMPLNWPAPSRNRPSSPTTAANTRRPPVTSACTASTSRATSGSPRISAPSASATDRGARSQ